MPVWNPPAGQLSPVVSNTNTNLVPDPTQQRDQHLDHCFSVMDEERPIIRRNPNTSTTSAMARRATPSALPAARREGADLAPISTRVGGSRAALRRCGGICHTTRDDFGTPSSAYPGRGRIGLGGDEVWLVDAAYSRRVPGRLGGCFGCWDCRVLGR